MRELSRLSARGRLVTLLGALALGCAGPGAGGDDGRGGATPTSGVAGCRPYRPAEAKKTFDGRVGTIVLHNASRSPVVARVYHPDGDGTQPEETWTLRAGADSTLGGGFGSDWGLQVGASCPVLLGRAARWAGGTFEITWNGTALVPGPSWGAEAAARPD